MPFFSVELSHHLWFPPCCSQPFQKLYKIICVCSSKVFWFVEPLTCFQLNCGYCYRKKHPLNEKKSIGCARVLVALLSLVWCLLIQRHKNTDWVFRVLSPSHLFPSLSHYPSSLFCLHMLGRFWCHSRLPTWTSILALAPDSPATTVVSWM